MTFDHRKSLPAVLQQSLPPEAQELYRQEYNNIWKQYQHTFTDVDALSAEELAHRKAWGKVKLHFVKGHDGSWRPRN